MPRAAAWLLCLTSCLSPLAEAGGKPSSTAQQRLFLSAWAAVQKGQLPSTATQHRLHHYVLYPYIQARILALRLQSGLNPELDREIERFVAHEGFTPASSMLYRRWLIHLAKAQLWPRFLAHYALVHNDEPINQALHCFRAQLAIQDNQYQLARTLGLALWRSGRPQDPACDPVFAWLDGHGLLTTQLVLERLDNALRLHNDALAKQMAARLPPARRRSALLRIAVQRQPIAKLPSVLSSLQDPDTLLIGLVRLAGSDPASAQRLLSQDRIRRRLSSQQQAEVQRALGSAWAQRHDPAGQQLLAALPADLLDETALTWGFRDALWHGDWQLAARWLGALDPEHQRDRAWRYWITRTNEHTIRNKDHAPATRAVYGELAAVPDYYGILAWDRLSGKSKAAPWIAAPPIRPDPSALRKLSELPQLQRAREWLLLHDLPAARRVWQDLLGRLSPTLREQAALLALSWRWDSEAVAAMRGLDMRSGFNVRYPMPYGELVVARAEQFAIPKSWIYAVMRSESLFRPDVASYAGALGLMQLMPPTAGDMARKLGMGPLSRQAILAIERNVLLGSAYLGELANRFSSNVALATAAYHAGPNRVKRWLPPRAMSMDVWVDNVPIDATRSYVRNVIRDYTIYSGRLGLSVALQQFDLPGPAVVVAEETGLSTTSSPRSTNPPN